MHQEHGRRVLQVVTKMDQGGLETFLMNTYRSIDRNKLQFDFLVHRNEPGVFDGEIVSLGGKIFQVPPINPLNPAYRKSLDEFFASHRYDVVHSHINTMSAIPLLAARRHGVTTRIAHAHSSRQEKNYKYPLKVIFKQLIKYVATDLFACSHEAGEWVFGTDDYNIINNAIEVSKFRYSEKIRSECRALLGISDNVLVVGHVGRFVLAKNHKLIIDIIYELQNLSPNTILLLIGEGELRPSVEEQVKSLGMESSVMFLGLRDDISQLMQAMDIFLMPSLYEGLPLVLVEAQASGLPCLISNSITCSINFEGSSISRKSVSAAPSAWAEDLLDISAKENNRASGSDLVRRAGFDAKYESRKLEDFYLSRFEPRH